MGLIAPIAVMAPGLELTLVLTDIIFFTIWWLEELVPKMRMRNILKHCRLSRIFNKMGLLWVKVCVYMCVDVGVKVCVCS